jgi:hypothetical protein
MSASAVLPTALLQAGQITETCLLVRAVHHPGRDR